MAIHVLAKEMGVERRISMRGRTITETPDREKSADYSWAPAYEPGSMRRVWPTVTLEVGYSEMRPKLEQDIAWWINRSGGQVRHGFIIDINRGSHNIYISSWELARPYDTRSGRVSTRANGSLPPPRRLQRVKLVPGRNGQPPVVEGGDLRLPFRNLALRDPGPNEGDFIFTRDILWDIAEPVWAAMDAAEEGDAPTPTPLPCRPSRTVVVKGQNCIWLRGVQASEKKSSFMLGVRHFRGGKRLAQSNNILEFLFRKKMYNKSLQKCEIPALCQLAWIWLVLIVIMRMSLLKLPQAHPVALDTFCVSQLLSGRKISPQNIIIPALEKVRSDPLAGEVELSLAIHARLQRDAAL
ncbi:hypothetical protein AJ80_02934 [Polytolypa hystricis UAMH7299]|uniref:Uncharacterized protein n=1 Tax=Polytolypa hystricis (strain UAMH7299) TaxID=1447883 RepID=A0A2B7YPQ1_POLH7|nr:hypothetical protein AJ80_02934 [Polytolypa hystricis UAMH7299]